jgi:hypothetical protein
VTLDKRRTANAVRMVATQPSSRTKGESSEVSAEKQVLGPCWRHVVRGGRDVRAIPAACPHPTRDLVTETPTRSLKTNTSKKIKTSKSEPKIKVGTMQVPVTKWKNPAKPLQSKTKELVVPPQPNQIPTEISDLLENLTLMCAAYSQDLHIRPKPPLLARSLVNCSQNRCLLCR